MCTEHGDCNEPDRDFCYECDTCTRWDGETCTGCGRQWGHPLSDVPV